MIEEEKYGVSLNDNDIAGLNDSKLDTFSPKVFQERQSRENLHQIKQTELKYSIEFINETQNTTINNNNPDYNPL